MIFVADLHIHSHFSRATSPNLTFEHLARWAQLKGIHVVAAGDVSHPGWLAEMRDKLIPAEAGLYCLKDDLARAVQAQTPPACHAPVRFILGGEISNIYKRDGQTRKVHNVVFAPSFDVLERLQARLEKIGNIRADGRPILGLDSRDLLEILLETDADCQLIPAHIWTPWFSLLGSKSGFDSVAECFADLTPHIFALETGLSSDPPMNWRVAALDRYTLVSNSDAHSPEKLGREANLFDCELAYDALFDALRGNASPFRGTIEFFPEEGKYHFDGHRACNIAWAPPTTRSHNGLCPVCGKPVTVGVMHRVAALADRPEGFRPAHAVPFYSLIPLPEILGEVYRVGESSKQVQVEYLKLLTRLGPELAILRNVPLADITQAGGERLAEGIGRMRRGEVSAQPGYDGEYGVIRVFGGARVSETQVGLFGDQTKDEGRKTAAAVREQSGLFEIAEEEPENATQQAEDPGAPNASGALAAQLPSRNGASRLTFHASRLFDGLNEQQRAAVRCTDAPLAIIAGPGTGKTRTLTTRIAHLILAQGVVAENVLAITFTNKAAGEMQERLAGLLAPPKPLGFAETDSLGIPVVTSSESPTCWGCPQAHPNKSGTPARQSREILKPPETLEVSRVTIKTFHAFGAGLLRQHADRLGLSPQFVILAGEDRAALLRQACPELKAAAAAAALAQISAMKNSGIEPSGGRSVAATRPVADATSGNGQLQDTRLMGIFQRYNAALRAGDAVDFDDLLLLPVRLLEAHPDVLAATQSRYRWISVDEYQDVNAAQYRLLRLLTGAGETGEAGETRKQGDTGGRINLCVIGDPDQAIYGFRGADPRYFRRFEQDYPGARVLSLSRNYRSSRAILDAAAQVIARNPDRKSVRILAEFADEIKLDVYRAPTDKAEAEYVVHQIEQMVGGTSYFSLDSARVTGETPPAARAFADFAVLYRLSAQTRPLIEAFDRSGIPYQTVGQTSLYEYKAVREALAHLWRLYNPRAPLLAAQVANLRHLETDQPVARLIEQIVERLAEGCRKPVGDADAERLRQLVLRAVPFGDRLADFLEMTALQSETDAYDPRADRVTLMSLHASKGLEFPVVFIVGCEEGLLPYERVAQPAAGHGQPVDIAEERRLFYVGLTRAGRKLILTHARKRVLFGQFMENAPSRFVGDIEAVLKEIQEMKYKPPEKKDESKQLTLF